MNRSRQHPNHDRWLVSYADFITLLFAFFVVLYASAQADRHRMGQLANAIQAGFQQMSVFTGQSLSLAPTYNTQTDLSPSSTDITVSVDLRRLAAEVEERNNIERVRSKLESELRERNISPRIVSVRTDTEGVVVSLHEVGFFESGSARMPPQAVALFGQVAALLAEQQCQLRIEGHTDNVPIHNTAFKSNWELSTARATEVTRLLITRYGFDPQDLSAAGYAEFHPIATNETAEGRSANRRTDIVVMNRRAHAFARLSAH